MTTLTVTARGQVTFRKDVLRHLGIKPGEKIELSLLPGGAAALKAAQAAGVRVGFTTGFTRALPHRILTELGWGDRLLVPSDEVERGRPAPDMVHEAIGVALLMGGGPASTYATHALRALEQFSA